MIFTKKTKHRSLDDERHTVEIVREGLIVLSKELKHRTIIIDSSKYNHIDHVFDPTAHSFLSILHEWNILPSKLYEEIDQLYRDIFDVVKSLTTEYKEENFIKTSSLCDEWSDRTFVLLEAFEKQVTQYIN